MVRSVSWVACSASRVMTHPRTSISSSNALVAASSPPSSRQHRLASGRPSWVTKVTVSKDTPSPVWRDANDPALQRAARKLVDQHIERDLGEGNTFGFESTYSGRSRPDIVRAAPTL